VTIYDGGTFPVLGFLRFSPVTVSVTSCTFRDDGAGCWLELTGTGLDDDPAL
jgi:hypothetical protein